jgi:nitrogen fixation protein FixH
MTMARTGEFTGRHMLLITIAFFTVVIGVNVAMAVSASRTWTGLVVANSYVASQDFQVKSDAAHRQNAAGWTMDIAYRDGRLIVQIAADGRELELSQVEAFVRRPVGGSDDATVPLSLGPGGYEGAIDLAPGVWDVTVTTAPTALGAIERETRIMVR